MQDSENSHRAIKAILCQLGTPYEEKRKNIERAQISLSKYTKQDHLDIIVFPESSFTRYNFASQEDAASLAATQGKGQQFSFAISIAQKLSTYVVLSYIEKVETAIKTTLYSSAAVFNRQGAMIANYRKCHLYYNDKIWAEEGKRFVNFQLRNSEGKTFQCVLALGSDLNQKDFTSGKFELAQHVIKTKADLLILPMSWVDSQNKELHRNDISGTYNYWLNRLSPVNQSKRGLLVLVANKVGIEFDQFAKKQIAFYGSSTAIMLNPHKFISNLDITNEGFLLIDTFLL